MRRNLLTVLNYFGYFFYAPSHNEIHTFFPQKITKKHLSTLLNSQVKRRKILRLPKNMSFGAFQGLNTNFTPDNNNPRYTLPQYSIPTLIKLRDAGKIGIKKKVLTIQIYIFILTHTPLVKFVGVTGASAMNGLQKNDDLDLFIISKSSYLWTTRFFVVLLAKILGIHTKVGVCLNLFFDESDLSIPRKKQNSYIAHELLQMKPLINKDDTYERFLSENKWIQNYFPNAQKFKPQTIQTKVIQSGITQSVDYLFKSIQFPLIIRNKADFFITPTQLWLFKSDFEKKLKRAGLVI